MRASVVSDLTVVLASAFPFSSWAQPPISAFTFTTATMLVLQLLLASVAAARVMHSLPGVPDGWTFVRDASSTDRVALRIALRQQYAEELEAVVLNVSTPSHPDYGRHLTRDGLRSYTAPAADSVAAVSTWLGKYDIAPIVDNDWVIVTTTAGQAGALLGTNFSWYQHTDGGSPKLRTLQYTVPDSLVPHIDMVQPTTRFGQLAARRSMIFDLHPASADDTASSVTAANAVLCDFRPSPACIKSLYGINYTVTDTVNNRVAFSSYLKEYARYKDLELFESKFVPSAVGQNVSVELINGGLNNQTWAGDSSTF